MLYPTDDAAITSPENLPLPTLLVKAKEKLSSSGILQRGASLPLYKNIWRRGGIANTEAFTLDDIGRLPFISARNVIAEKRDLSHAGYAGRHIQLWVNARMEETARCWLPRGAGDIVRYENNMARLAGVLGINRTDTVLALSQPAPDASNLMPYALTRALRTVGIQAQIIPLNIGILEHAQKWLDFLVKSRPTVMLAQPEAALELARVIRAQGITQTGADDKRQPLGNLRLIQLFGNNTPADQQAVSTAYGVKTLASLGMFDLGLFAQECPRREGVHLWLDTGLYEIIPKTELEQESQSREYKPRASWVWETPKHTRGEMVVTCFDELQPLIRFRTGKLVETQGAETCGCGRSHPRVKLI